MDLSSDEEELWCDIADIVEKYWKSRANCRPLIQKVFDSWVELINKIKKKQGKIREMEYEYCTLKVANKDLIEMM